MKNKYITISFTLSFLYLISFALAHGEELGMSPWKRLGIPNPNTIIMLSGMIIFAAIFSALLFRKKFREGHKKVIFVIIAATAIVGTLYLGGATIYLNQKSWSSGPVHWHADFEIWACDQKVDIIDPSGLQNFVGEHLIHEHGDNRIHIEGVILDKEDATLGHFFEALGGEFTENTLAVPTSEGLKTWKNGDKCNERSGVWYTFINSGYIPSQEAVDYLISPWQTIPPGDTIKFVFTEKDRFDIKANIGVPP